MRNWNVNDPFCAGCLGCLVLFALGNIGSPSEQTTRYPQRIEFHGSSPVGGPPGHEAMFGQGTYRATFLGLVPIGSNVYSCNLSAGFLNKKYKLSFASTYFVKSGDVVAALGGMFQANCNASNAVFDRVPEKSTPKSVIPPQWDSIIVPAQGRAGFDLTEIQIAAIGNERRKDVNATLHVKYLYIGQSVPADKKGLFAATVKVGDILMIRDFGHEVRAIVPAKKEARISGWLEFAPQPIPQRELVREKKSFTVPVSVLD